MITQTIIATILLSAGAIDILVALVFAAKNRRLRENSQPEDKVAQVVSLALFFGAAVMFALAACMYTGVFDGLIK